MGEKEIGQVKNRPAEFAVQQGGLLALCNHSLV